MSQSSAPTPDAKWVKGVSAKQTVHQAARRILRSRLSAVWYWLPLAAEKSDENIEYVHQLRVSTRRAVEAVRVFSDLMTESACGTVTARLRQLRQAADEARNLDVFCAEFVRCSSASCEETCRHAADAVSQRRQSAQQPIVALYRELAAENFNDRIADLLQEIKSQTPRKPKRPFGQQAPRYLEPVVKRFFKACQANWSDEEALHKLRIRTKKLRYTMEILAVAFKPCFRKQLYRRISALQDVMGMVNDHATAKTFFGEWIVETEDAQQKAFFRGILLAETKAHDDLRHALSVIWTPQAVRELRQQFRACCGIS